MMIGYRGRLVSNNLRKPHTNADGFKPIQRESPIPDASGRNANT